MSQMQKTPQGSGGSTTDGADKLAGNKLAEIASEKAKEFLEVSQAPKAKQYKTVRKYIVCSICYLQECPFGHYLDIQVEI